MGPVMRMLVAVIPLAVQVGTNLGLALSFAVLGAFHAHTGYEIPLEIPFVGVLVDLIWCVGIVTPLGFVSRRTMAIVRFRSGTPSNFALSSIPASLAGCDAGTVCDGGEKQEG